MSMFFKVLIYWGLHGDVLWKVFTSLFPKSDRPSNARSVGRLHRGEISFSAFLFC